MTFEELTSHLKSYMTINCATTNLIECLKQESVQKNNPTSLLKNGLRMSNAFDSA